MTSSYLFVMGTCAAITFALRALPFAVFCIKKTTRWASGSKKPTGDEKDKRTPFAIMRVRLPTAQTKAKGGHSNESE